MLFFIKFLASGDLYICTLKYTRKAVKIMQTSNNIGFGAVHLKDLKIGTAVQFNKGQPKLAGQIRQVLHIGAKPCFDTLGGFGIDLSHKLVILKDLGSKKVEQVTVPAGGIIHFLDLLT